MYMYSVMYFVYNIDHQHSVPFMKAAVAHHWKRTGLMEREKKPNSDSSSSVAEIQRPQEDFGDAAHIQLLKAYCKINGSWSEGIRG